SYLDGIDEIVASIREKGLIQPIIVRPSGSRFEVVAGARRLEACRRLRWCRVPCIIRELSDQDAFEISLTENIQRKTMNIIEEAEAFKKYVDQHGWGSESQLAKKMGKSQEYISQRLSLLSLSKSIQNKIIRRLINGSVAQEIARLEDPKIQEHLSEEVVKHHLTVGMVRETARSINRGESQERSKKSRLQTRIESQLWTQCSSFKLG
ncbi:MAG: ParB/RepB/Spo0J family partition protein, partial [Thaumarchaeota archaeon]|nr:ParB/RepB/Spo0J family partition protein [Nitrososphaerota archaeon]